MTFSAGSVSVRCPGIATRSKSSTVSTIRMNPRTPQAIAPKMAQTTSPPPIQ
jgi:hypothetical protein